MKLDDVAELAKRVAKPSGEGVGRLFSLVHGSKHTVRSKRRRVDIASLREAVESEAIALAHCDTHDMAADGLTKRSEALRPPLVRAMQGELILP